MLRRVVGQNKKIQSIADIIRWNGKISKKEYDGSHTILQINEWDQVVSFLEECKKSSEWVYRGLPDSNFKLMPTIHRLDMHKNIGAVKRDLKSLVKNIEQVIDDKKKLQGYLLALKNKINDMDRIYVARESLEEVYFQLFEGETKDLKDVNYGSIFEQLCVMQHYGLPTRLLDFTLCPYVAAFFAFKYSGDKNCDCAIWIINQEWCKAKALENMKKIMSDINEDTDLTKDKYFKKLFWENDNNKKLKYVYPFCPPEKVCPRVGSQKSIFLCQKDMDSSFESNLSFAGTEDDILECRQHVIKLEMPVSSNGDNEILDDLKEKKGLTIGSLFGSMDQYAIYIKRQIEFLNKDACNRLKMMRNEFNKLQE
jgi:hypothetical protein